MGFLNDLFGDEAARADMLKAERQRFEKNMLESLAEFATGLAPPGNGLSAGLPVSECQDRIVGTHVAVNTDTVEGSLHRLKE